MPGEIKLEKVCFKQGKVSLLREISFSVKRGEILVISGRSGEERVRFLKYALASNTRHRAESYGTVRISAPFPERCFWKNVSQQGMFFRYTLLSPTTRFSRISLYH
jgi:ABC-type transporter Mla maintaining outer membrane lipid asymmetry ATPase subunit MlaF